MANNIGMFPKVSSSMIEKIGVFNDINVFYKKNDDENYVCVESKRDILKEKQILLCPEKNDLNNEIHDLKFKGHLQLEDLSILNKFQLLDLNTTIGVGLYVNTGARFSFTKKIGEFSYVEKLKSLKLEFEFSITAGMYSNKIILKQFFYLVNEGDSESKYASLSGTRLGDIDELIYSVDGNGSIFPIKVINDINMPLWSIDFQPEDLYDEFNSDIICLKINTASKDFDKIGSSSISSDNSCMWKEMLSSFFTTIFLSLSDDEIRCIFENEYDNNTIGLFLKNLFSIFNLNINDFMYKINILLKVHKRINDLID